MTDLDLSKRCGQVRDLWAAVEKEGIGSPTHWRAETETLALYDEIPFLLEESARLLRRGLPSTTVWHLLAQRRGEI